MSRNNGKREAENKVVGQASSTAWTLTLGLVFHLVYIYSVFDCYFTSPVVHGMAHFSTGKAAADRLVLIIGDGLRSDLLFNLNPFPSIPDAPKIVAPYLRNIVEERGAFGVSHTHVPTESRPGHVAIIGGMYEDVSAVTKGWKSNPVDFDSVFNQSRHTFSFGSPDILPIFSHGAPPNKIDTWMYNEEDEDFTKDATELDVWALDQLKQLFRNASGNTILEIDIKGEQTVFFLHLLGLDTTGHSYRPHSKEYMRNIQIVDSIVQEAEELFSDFFQDDKTAYVFTADHGMSNIGNHGDGNPDSTRTPLIAWGAGVRGPLEDSAPSSHDAYSAPWGLSHLFRRDVEQADIAPLMSTLLGLDLPVNSVGVLPDVDVSRPGYLALRERDVAHAAVANAKSVLEHYRMKHRIKQSHKVFFTPFPGLATRSSTGSPGSGHLLHIQHLLDTEKWTQVRDEANKLIQLSLRGIRYLETYDRTMLRIIVAIGYAGWAAYSASALLLRTQAPRGISAKSSTRCFVDAISLSIFVLSSAFFAFQKESSTYYLYVAFPCYFWRSVALSLNDCGKDIEHVPSMNGEPKSKASRVNTLISPYLINRSVIANMVLAFLSLQAMVIAYKRRWIWSIGLAVMSIVWPLISWPRSLKASSPSMIFKWIAACMACAIFPLRDVEQGESLPPIVIGGLLMLLVGSVMLQRVGDQQYKRWTALQLTLTLLSLIVTSHSVYRLSNKLGLPISNQIAGWLVFVLSALLPFILPFRSFPEDMKLLTIFLAFCPCFVILSICAEGLFYLTYCATLVTWVEVECAVRSASEGEGRKIEERQSVEGVYHPRTDDIRIALFFLFFVQIAFFGTGNVASISSFYLEPVYRLVPVFSPFIMAALLIFKIIAPYVFLSAMFATLCMRLRMPPFSLFLVALSLTDVMTVTFFLNVTDNGSWLEIGQSISFFVIASLLLLWSAGVTALGSWLMREDSRNLRIDAASRADSLQKKSE